jgi:hypothetical protein
MTTMVVGAMVGAMVVALVGPAEPAGPTFARQPWERARRRWFRMAPPSLLHPDAFRRPPCASMSSLFRLGSGR